ncbi:MAG TPA: Vms1/Ankzf1 family peptidyl-tRNA hydrolase [Candidatus Thermoplasmatota archaeon]|nr:Vms1/Ankzf1 family peptidyl-tRNA hydrolase [Candidatus Thermoplasmatota archaeon]
MAPNTKVPNEKDLIKLRQTLKELKETKRNEGTVLVSLLIPAGANLQDAVNLAQSEYALAGNVKSKQTRNAVEAALGKVIAGLQSFRKLPENGLAVYASDENLWMIEPPVALTQRLYRCEKQFILEPVEELLMDPGEPVALLTVDHNHGTLARLHGKGYKIIKEFIGFAHGKMSVGGQSAMRFERLRQENIQQHYRNIESQFRELVPDCKTVVLGGPGMSPDEFVKETDFSGKGIKILGPFSTGYTDEQGIKELMFAAMEQLKESKAAVGENEMRKFLEMLAKDDGRAVYGPAQIAQALQEGALEKLLLTTDRLPPEEWLNTAEQYKTNIVWVGDELENGAMLKNTFGGAAGIRRWATSG